MEKICFRNMNEDTFSQKEIQILNRRGLADEQIAILTKLNISFNEVIQTINAIMDKYVYCNSDSMSEQVMIELLNKN